MKRLALAMILMSGLSSVQAQQISPLVFSGGKNFVGKDVIQLEYGFNFERQQDKISSINQQLSQYALVKYGLRHHLDFSFSYNYSKSELFISDQMRRANGMSNILLGFKKQLAKNYSLQSNIGFSRLDSGKRAGSFQILGISEHAIDSYLAWENNLGLNWASGSPQANVSYLSGLTFTIPYPFDIIVEVYGQYGPSVWNNYGNIGFGYYFTSDLMVEAYAGFGQTNQQQSTFFSFNFYWRLVPSRYFEEDN